MSTEKESVMEAIKVRRSIRTFTDEPLTKGEISEIVEAGRYAPSAKNMQPWRFIVITDKELIGELERNTKALMRKVIKYKSVLELFVAQLRNEEVIDTIKRHSVPDKPVLFYDAPVLIFILSKNNSNDFDDLSCACAAQNMMLAAHSMGLGSCWIGLAQFLKYNRGAYEKIGVPSGYHVVGVLVFGHPEVIPKMPERKKESSIIRWIGPKL